MKIAYQLLGLCSFGHQLRFSDPSVDVVEVVRIEAEVLEQAVENLVKRIHVRLDVVPLFGDFAAEPFSFCAICKKLS